jgi:hypothetical protein
LNHHSTLLPGRAIGPTLINFRATKNAANFGNAGKFGFNFDKLEKNSPQLIDFAILPTY